MLNPTIDTEERLREMLAALGDIDEETRNSVTCSLIGHSRIQTTCFGYYYCGRCSAQLGDALGGVYNAAKLAVIVGHACDACRQNFAACTWRDTLFAPAPFPETETAEG